MFTVTPDNGTCDDVTLPDPALANHVHAIPVSVDEDTFTILIRTFRRTPMLIQSLKHYSNMNNVDRIVVSWGNVGVEPPDLDALVQPRAPIAVRRMESSNLSLRFSPYEAIQTQGELKQ